MPEPGEEAPGYGTDEPVEIRVEAELRRAPAFGDPRLVERLVANLVDNAGRHNVPGGWIRVWTGLHDGRPTVRVTNSGPVVPPARVDSLFQPFLRMEATRTSDDGGLGLGLSIVAAIATAPRRGPPRHGPSPRRSGRPGGLLGGPRFCRCRAVAFRIEQVSDCGGGMDGDSAESERFVKAALLGVAVAEETRRLLRLHFSPAEVGGRRQGARRGAVSGLSGGGDGAGGGGRMLRTDPPGRARQLVTTGGFRRRLPPEPPSLLSGLTG
ncbi:ATP-binding protein [Nonomuraea dietziae]|uniref:sensor histidine kinase n=1 Tax=Nonomuraea dietziae TaxID=65515 RepID=UPI0031E0ACC9